jgi:hypothetical protein
LKKPLCGFGEAESLAESVEFGVMSIIPWTE